MTKLSTDEILDIHYEIAEEWADLTDALLDVLVKYAVVLKPEDGIVFQNAKKSAKKIKALSEKMPAMALFNT